MSRVLLACLLPVTVAACGPAKPQPQSPDQKIQADQDAYRTLEKQLEQRRHQFLPNTAMNLAARSSTLYWLDLSNWAPTLHAYDDVTRERVDYGFSIGSGDDYNYGASSTVIVTADRSSGLVYRAYDASKGNLEIDELNVSVPSDNQKWWAYAVDGNSVYYVTTSNGTEFYRWTPGSGAQPQRLFSLEELGMSVGEFMDLSVSGNELLFIESGRLWWMDLVQRKPIWLKNQTEISGEVTFNPQGVLYESAGGVFYYDLATGGTMDIAAAINQSSFKINDTYSSSHLYRQGATLHGSSQVIYVGQDGVFSYDLHGGAVAPILLSPIDPPTHIVYENPTVLDDGTLFVTGWTTTDGAAGVGGGAVYRVDLRG